MERLTPNPLTGPAVPPPQPRTIWWICCWNAYCDSKSIVEGLSHDEAWEKYEEGRARGLYGSVYESGTRQGLDPEEVTAYNKAVYKIRISSCLLPPPEDLMLIHKAKRTLPADYASIHPEEARWKYVRELLYSIRNEKYNQNVAEFWRTHTP